MIKIIEIYACNSEELEKKLNEIDGNIISVEYMNDDFYKIIYNENNFNQV
jgi:hypothetical protein